MCSCYLCMYASALGFGDVFIEQPRITSPSKVILKFVLYDDFKSARLLLVHRPHLFIMDDEQQLVHDRRLNTGVRVLKMAQHGCSGLQVMGAQLEDS